MKSAAIPTVFIIDDDCGGMRQEQEAEIHALQERYHALTA
jgi:hypothetical protein